MPHNSILQNIQNKKFSPIYTLSEEEPFLSNAAKMWMKKMKGKLMVDLVDGDKIEFKLLFPKVA